MTKASRYPVSSFGPELLAILLKGATQRVTVPCPDQRTMQHLQMRLQMLRGAMGREGHPNYQLVTRARTSRDWDTDPLDGTQSNFRLLIQPNDSQFAKLIKDAGVVATSNDRDLLNEALVDLPQMEAPTIDPYAKFKEPNR